MGGIACLALLSYHLDRAVGFGTQGRLLWLISLAAALVGALFLTFVAPWLRRAPDVMLAVWA
ncbi:MAG: hypothetical protein FJX72_20885, partial [Armatimonadetes bacterium]|nr:hypothetical protein [Armatimonadota bacterium]